MKLSLEQVKKVAKLANLNLSEKEESLYFEQLSKILDYVDQLNQVDTSSSLSSASSSLRVEDLGVEPTFNVSGLNNVMREDNTGESLTQEEALSNAPVKKDGMFITKGVFGE